MACDCQIQEVGEYDVPMEIVANTTVYSHSHEEACQWALDRLGAALEAVVNADDLPEHHRELLRSMVVDKAVGAVRR